MFSILIMPAGLCSGTRSVPNVKARAHPQHTCCVVSIFFFCWRPMRLFENARSVSFTCISVSGLRLNDDKHHAS